MLFLSRKKLIPLCAALLLGGCGASAVDYETTEELNLTGEFAGAVWYAEFGDPSATTSSIENLIAEDGLIRPETILLTSPGGESSYLNGVSTLDVPDQDPVYFTANIGFPFNAQSGASAHVQIYVQDQGVEFPVLADLTISADGELDQIVADLSAFRGQSVLFIVSISALENSPLANRFLLISPRFSNSLR